MPVVVQLGVFTVSVRFIVPGKYLVVVLTCEDIKH